MSNAKEHNSLENPLAIEATMFSPQLLFKPVLNQLSKSETNNGTVKQLWDRHDHMDPWMFILLMVTYSEYEARIH